jgi:hypothetical protein
LKRTSEGEKPLFVVWHGAARTIAIAISIAISLSFASLFIDAALLSGPVTASRLFLLGLGAIFIITVIAEARLLLKDWRFTFYEDRFEVTHAGRNNASIHYRDIQGVRCLPYNWVSALFSGRRGFGYRPPRIVVNTYLQRESSSLEIFGNPHNRQLGMHLCDWLTQKVGRPSSSTKSAE